MSGAVQHRGPERPIRHDLDVDQRSGRTPERFPAHPVTPATVKQLSRMVGNRGMTQLLAGTRPSARLQRCAYCGRPSCAKGEQCKLDPSFGGLFSPTVDARAVGPHKETKKHSQVKTFESEHMLPSDAWKRSGLAHEYDELPTMSIPYSMHRGGVSGAGGGVTSTGGSATAKGWADLLGGLMKSGNVAEAVRRTAVDEFNAAVMSGNLDEGRVSQIVSVVNLHATRKDITEPQAAQINEAIMNRWLDATRPKQSMPAHVPAGGSVAKWLLIAIVVFVLAGLGWLVLQ